MNEHELRHALDRLAGPASAADVTARAAVARRVRNARCRIGALSVAIVLVVGLGAVGIAQSAATGGRVDDVVAGRPARCRPQIPPPVPRARVPAVARAWASNRPVVGGGSLWTTRRVLRQAPVREGAIRRFKFGWLVLPAVPGGPAPTLTAREVDGPGRAVGEVGEAFDQHGRWFASAIELRGARTCWEITARLGDDVIGFRRSIGR
jgi:hypothetical protein